MKRLTASLVLLASAQVASAQQLPDELVRAEVIGGWRTPSGTQMAAVRLRMADGWKTYWRAPGEAGIPPQFDWSASENVQAVRLHWPVPEVFDLNGLRTLGYSGELVLPVEITPAAPDGPIVLSGDLDIGVCEEVCVPVSLSVSADLPPASAREPRIEAALTRQPETGDDAGLSLAQCAAEAIRDGLRLTATLMIPNTGAGEFGVIELADASVWVSPASASRDGGRITLVADLVPAEAKPFALDRSDVRITLFGGGRAVDIHGCTG